LKSKIQNKKNQLKIYEKNIMPALEKNYKVTLLAYEQNTEDLFVVLDARQSLQMTQLEYYNQLQELLLLQVEYEKEIEKQ
jgi:outer membrane protein TolC